MRRIISLLLLLTLLTFHRPAYAQGNPKLSSTEIWIWPEYDKPSVLVIQRIMVDPATSFPVAVTFRIPAAAKEPSALAVGNTFSTASDQAVDFTLEPDGEWVDVIVTATGPAILLEYYDPTFTKTGKERSYSFVWVSNYTVDSFSVDLQQPFDASNMKTDPSLPNINPSSDGLTYYTGNFGAQVAGQIFTLNISYTKASDALSVSVMTVQPSTPVDENTAGRVSLETYLPWLIGAFGILMIAGGFYYYIRGGARPRPATRRRRHTGSENPAEGQTYCPQCGTRARRGDRFCRTCGTRLRQSNED